KPVYGSGGASGADVRAAVAEPVCIQPGARALIPTGLHLHLPEGYEVQLRPRSGLALNHGITVLNSPGTIDSDYRGEIMVILINLGDKPFTVQRGDRIAQMVFSITARAEFICIDGIERSERGNGGFGSTGIQ
ncbi:MAG: dUTP diphosphatase, partial [Spirochaetota bacterium]